MPTRRRAAVVLAALSIGFCAASAGAQASHRNRVELTVVGGEEKNPLTDTIRELLGRLRLDVSTEQNATASPASLLARVQVDVSASNDDIVVVVSSARTGGVLLRRSFSHDPSASIQREQIAHAVQSAVESELLAEEDRASRAAPIPVESPGGQAPPPALSEPSPSSTQPEVVLPRIAAPPADEPPIPKLAARSRVALDVSTLAGAGPFATGAGPVAHVAAGLSVASRRGPRPSIGLTVQYLLPFDATSPAVVLHASVISARVTPAIELVRGSWVSVDVGMGAGFDALTVEPGSTVLPPSRIGSPTTRVDAVLCAVVAGRFALTPGVVLVVAAVGDLDLASRRYVVDQGNTQDGLLVPWRVRPTLLAGFTFAALGEGLFPGKGAR